MASKFESTVNLNELKKMVQEVVAKEIELISTDNKLTESQTKVAKAVKTHASSQTNLKKNLSSAKQGMDKINTAAAEGSKQANKWNYSWTKAFQSFTTYMSVTTVFYQTIHAIRDMIDEVTELDGALVELKKVTDLEGESLQKFTKEAYAAGADVAKTGTEMIEAATSFAKAGYSEDQILQLGKVAAMYTNIADEAISSADAADFIIAQLKAFNLESKDMNETLSNAYHIIDAVNEFSNNFAVSSSDIATNLGKASSVMANAGNSMEQMIGLMAAGTEVTRNASKVANGLKTITLRLQGMDDEGEENLELVAQMEALYKKLGITVYKTDGTMKNTYELLETLAPIYQEATAAEKAYITETIAGKYQAQNAAAILNNFAVAVEATGTAMDSTGSAINENSKYVDSIKGKLANLSSEFEQLSTNLINSSLVKWIIDLGAAMLSLANTGVGKIILNTTILTTALLVASKSFTVLHVKLKALKLGIIDYCKYQILLYAQSKNQTIANYAEAASYLGLAVSIKAVTVAMMTNPLFLTGAAVAAVITFTTAIDNAQQKTLEMAEASRQAASDLQSLDENLSTIVDDEVISKLEKYKEVLSDSASTSTELATANDGLKDIQKKLNDLFGEGKIDVYNDSVDKTIEKIKKLTDEELQLYRVKNESKLQDARQATIKDINSDNINISKGDSDPSKRGYRDFLGDFLQSGDYGSTNFGHGGINTRINGEAEDAMKFLNDALNYVKNNREKLKEQYGYTEKDLEDLQNQLSENYNKIDETYTEHINFLKTYHDTMMKYVDGGTNYEKDMKTAASDGKLTDKEIKGILDKYPKVAELLKDVGYDYDDLRKKFITGKEDTNAAADNISNAYDKVSQARQKAMEANTADKLFSDMGENESYITELYDKMKSLADGGELSSKTIRQAIKDMDNWTETNGNLVYSLDGTTVSIADLITYFSILNDNTHKTDEQLDAISQSLDNIQSAYDTATEAVKEYNEQGYLSVDTLQALADMDGEHLEYLFNEANQLSINEAGFRNLAIAQLELLKVKQQEKLLDYVKSLKDEGSQLDTNQEKVNNLTEALEKQNTELAKNIALSSVEGDFTADEQAAIEKRVQAVSAYFQQINGTINKISSGVGRITSSSNKSSSSSSTKKEKEWWETELEKLKDQFKYNEITIEEYIRGLDNLLGKVGKGTDAWRKINEELQKQRLTKVEDDYKRGTISLDEYIKKLKELIKAYKQGSDAWNDLADKIKKALQDKADRQKDDLATAEDAALKIIDKQIEKQKELRDEKEAYWDEEISNLEKANEETEKAIELARLEEALENAKNEKTKRVWHEGLGKKLAEYKDNYIGQMLEIVKTEVRLNLRWCVYG